MDAQRGGRGVNQLAMALEQRDEGIRQSAEHAEDVSPGWGEAAYTALTLYAGMAGEFNAFQFREYLKSVGLEASVPKAVGAVMLRAARAGIIRKVGYDPHPERHASPTCRWVRAAA